MKSASAAAVGFAYLCFSFAALQLSTFLNAQCGAGTGTGTGTTTSAEAPLLDYSAAEVLPPLAAVVVLFVAVALIYYHNLNQIGRRVVVAVLVARAGNANGRRSISGLVMFLLCVAAGTLELILFGQSAGGGGGGAGHGALGLAALRALPAAATVTFFSGMLLVVAAAAYVPAGGGAEAGGAGAVAGDGPMIQGLLRVLTKVAAGMAAALVVLMAMAIALLHGAKY